MKRTRGESGNVFRTGGFRAMLVATTADDLAQAAVPIALSFMVLQEGYSALGLGLVLGLRSVTSLVFMVAGGWLGDRFSRALVLVGANGLAGVALLILVAFSVSGRSSLTVLLAAAVVNGVFGALAAPASGALVPLVVQEDLIGTANSVVRLWTNGAAVGGAALAGIVASSSSAATSLALAGAAYIFAAACYVPLIRFVRHERLVVETLVGPLRAGWRILWKTPWIWITVVSFAAINAIYQGAFLVLGPTIAATSFGSGGWGLIIAAQVVGFIIGGLLSIRFNKSRRLAIGYLCAITMAAPLIGLAFGAPLVVEMFLAAIAGIGGEQLAVAWATAIQKNVPLSNLSSVVAFDLIGSASLQPVGQLAIASVAVAIGDQIVLLGGAALILAVLVPTSLTDQIRRPQPVRSQIPAIPN